MSRYTRDFLLTFQDACLDAPQDYDPSSVQNQMLDVGSGRGGHRGAGPGTESLNVRQGARLQTSNCSASPGSKPIHVQNDAAGWLLTLRDWLSPLTITQRCGASFESRSIPLQGWSLAGRRAAPAQDSAVGDPRHRPTSSVQAAVASGATCRPHQGPLQVGNPLLSLATLDTSHIGVLCWTKHPPL